MASYFRIANSAVLALWLILIGYLSYRDYHGTHLSEQRAQTSITKAVHWYDIYGNDVKVGSSSLSMKKIGDSIILEDRKEIKVKNDNENDGEIKTLISEVECLCNTDFSIRSIEYRSHFKDEAGIVVKGEVDKDVIIFFLESPSLRKTHKVATGGKPFYLPLTALLAINNQRPPVNSSFDLPIINFIDLNIENVRIKLADIIPVKIGLQIDSVFKYKLGSSYIWTDEKGVVIKEQLRTGITRYLQSENRTIDPASRLLYDYTDLPYFKSNRIIDDTQALKSVRFSIKGISPDKELYRNSEATMNDGILTVVTSLPEILKKSSYSLPYSNNDLLEFISADMWISSDVEAFQRTGRAFAHGRHNDPYALSKYLTGYVYGLVNTSLSFFLYSSEEILQFRWGDNVEKTLMFATYARAGGLPTRIVGGFVYRNGFFYFHTWPEVWIGQWVAADPALSQFPADAFHVPLITGTMGDIISRIDELRSIKLEILETS